MNHCDFHSNVKIAEHMQGVAWQIHEFPGSGSWCFTFFTPAVPTGVFITVTMEKFEPGKNGTLEIVRENTIYSMLDMLVYVSFWGYILLCIYILYIFIYV